MKFEELLLYKNDDTLKENTKKLIREKLDDKGLPVYIYGTGGKTNFVISILHELGYSIQGIFVSEGRKKIDMYMGIKVFEWESSIANISSIALINGMITHEEIFEEKRKHESVKVFIDFWFDTILIDNYHALEFFKKHYTQIKWLYDNVIDDLSRKSIQRYWEILIKKTGGLYNELVRPNQYFQEDIFNFTDTETFIDCGAFIGDTAEEFIEVVNGSFNKIFSLEPDTHNFKILKRTAAQYEQMIALNIGVWDKRTKLQFVNNENSNSSIKEGGLSGTTEILVDAIDNFAKDEVVSFIKMDVEGAELNALKGASETIKRNKPKLAISIYHKLEDFTNIAQYIKELVPEYKLYVRCHELTLCELILYAKV